MAHICASHPLSVSENLPPGCWSEQPFQCISTLGIWTLPSRQSTNVPFVLKADGNVHLLLLPKYFTPFRSPPLHGDFGAFHFTCITYSLSVCNYIWCCPGLLLWVSKISWLPEVLTETAAVCRFVCCKYLWQQFTTVCAYLSGRRVVWVLSAKQSGWKCAHFYLIFG